jgi:hypothetical protein
MMDMFLSAVRPVFTYTIYTQSLIVSAFERGISFVAWKKLRIRMGLGRISCVGGVEGILLGKISS